MAHEILGILWYILIAILWIGFLILEGFTSGVGMIFLSAKNKSEGRVLQYTVGPYWDGSEVWFITAAGATFAAFPLVYAEVFSSLYTAIFLLLIMLIVRGVSMELVYHDENEKWQKGMSWAWVISSYGLALLLGVRFTNMFMDSNTLTESGSSFFRLLSLPGILGGLLFIAIYRTSGILWANVKASGDVVDRKLKSTKVTAIATALIIPILMMAFNSDTNLFSQSYAKVPVLWIIPILTMLVPILTIIFLMKSKYISAFFSNMGTMTLFMLVGYTGIFPYMSPGVTISEGMASFLTLKIMTIVTIVFLPIVLWYQGWKFYKFRQKIKESYFD